MNKILMMLLVMFGVGCEPATVPPVAKPDAEAQVDDKDVGAGSALDAQAKPKGKKPKTEKPKAK